MANPEQGGSLVERVGIRVLPYDTASAAKFLSPADGDFAELVLLFAHHRVDERKRALGEALAAIEGERLEEPDYGTSDDAYENALDDASAAIRALIPPAKEPQP